MNDLAAELRDADRDRYLSSLFAPAPLRPALGALYVFNAEIASVRDRVREAVAGELRLQWWREALAGERADEARASPTADALLEAIDTHRLPRHAFDDYIEARIFDLYNDPMPDRTALEAYCGQTAGAIIQLASLMLDAEAASRHGALAGHAGCMQAITGLLRLMPLHRARGQCYVPAEILDACGTDVGGYLSGDDPGAMAAVRSALVGLAREHATSFLAGAAGMPVSLRPAYLAAGLSPARLDRMQRLLPEDAAVGDISALRTHLTMVRRAIWGW